MQRMLHCSRDSIQKVEMMRRRQKIPRVATSSIDQWRVLLWTENHLVMMVKQTPFLSHNRYSFGQVPSTSDMLDSPCPVLKMVRWVVRNDDRFRRV